MKPILFHFAHWSQLQKCGNDTNDPRLLCSIWFSDCRKVGFSPPPLKMRDVIYEYSRIKTMTDPIWFSFGGRHSSMGHVFFLSILYMECYEFLNQITQTFLVQVQPWLSIFYHQWRHALFWFGSCFSLVINWKTFNFVCCDN